MGEHRFTRLFRRATGSTPYQFLLKKRLERARALLENTTLPIAELALEVGFGQSEPFHISVSSAFFGYSSSLSARARLYYCEVEAAAARIAITGVGFNGVLGNNPPGTHLRLIRHVAKRPNRPAWSTVGLLRKVR
jgi:hypothetical protein